MRQGDIRLEEELHANTRRSRITRRATLGGETMALKCYHRPLWGLWHWWRAHRGGRRLRRLGAPVPPIVHSGWVPAAGCFGFGTRYLPDHRPLREVLRDNEGQPDRQSTLIDALGQLMARVHALGILQPDGNLTNFLAGPAGDLVLVDEDDIRVSEGAVAPAQALDNLANIASRLPEPDMRERLEAAYLEGAPEAVCRAWQAADFYRRAEAWQDRAESKRARRGQVIRRRFD